MSQKHHGAVRGTRRKHQPRRRSRATSSTATPSPRYLAQMELHHQTQSVKLILRQPLDWLAHVSNLNIWHGRFRLAIALRNQSLRRLAVPTLWYSQLLPSGDSDQRGSNPRDCLVHTISTKWPAVFRSAEWCTPGAHQVRTTVEHYPVYPLGSLTRSIAPRQKGTISAQLFWIASQTLMGLARPALPSVLPRLIEPQSRKFSLGLSLRANVPAVIF